MGRGGRVRARLLPRGAALRVVDDAGAEHAYEAPLTWFMWIVREADATGRGVRRQQMMVGWDQSMGMMMGVLLGAAFLTIKRLGLPDTLTLPTALVIGCGGGWLMLWSAHRRLESHWDSLGQQWTEAGLSRGRCPLCVYRLRDSAVDQDGLVLCAECGAMWRAGRLGAHEDREPPPWRRALNALVGADTRRKMKDDTGRTFAAERLGRIAARRAQRDPQVAQIARDVRGQSAALRWMAMAAAVIVFALPAVILLLALTRGGAGGAFAGPTLPLMLLVGSGIPGVIVIGAIAHSEWGLRAATRREHLLAAGLCPVCAGREMAESEEAAVCTGCGAVWRRGAGG